MFSLGFNADPESVDAARVLQLRFVAAAKCYQMCAGLPACPHVDICGCLDSNMTNKTPSMPI